MFCLPVDRIEWKKPWEQGNTGKGLTGNVQKVPQMGTLRWEESVESHCMQVVHPGCYSLVVRLGGVMGDAAACHWPWREVQSINCILNYILWQSLKLGCQTGCSKMGKNQISICTLCQTLFLC